MEFDPSKKFDYENGFYLTCAPQRISKFVAHYELFKQTVDLAGDIAEFGVFKGASFSRFALLRELFCLPANKKIVGFDVFGEFPDAADAGDTRKVQEFTAMAGNQSIDKNSLLQSLTQRQLHYNVELVKGDICHTLPAWLEQNPHARFSLVNLDTDIYEPAAVILKEIWPRIVHGGILIADDYGVFPGETQAIDEFFADKPVTIRRFPHGKSPSYIVKQ